MTSANSGSAAQLVSTRAVPPRFLFFHFRLTLSPVKSRITVILLFSGLVLLLAPLKAQKLLAEKKSDGVDVSEGGSKVFFYQARPKSLDGKYERADYLHPVFSLNGNVITEDFPADHLHQRGIYWAWHQIIYKDKQIADGWSCENITWEVIDTRIRNRKDAITLDNDVLWRVVLADRLTPVIRENSRITVYPSQGDYRMIDFDIRLFAMLDSMKMGGSRDAKGYSGFSLRLKLPPDIRFLTKDKEVHAQELALEAGPWMDFVGSFDGANAPVSGVAVFCHPSNPGYPEPWIIRSEKSMQNPAFPGREAIPLPRSGWRLRYRVVIHNNSLDLSDVEKLFEAYSKDARR